MVSLTPCRTCYYSVRDRIRNRAYFHHRDTCVTLNTDSKVCAGLRMYARSHGVVKVLMFEVQPVQLKHTDMTRVYEVVGVQRTETPCLHPGAAPTTAANAVLQGNIT